MNRFNQFVANFYTFYIYFNFLGPPTITIHPMSQLITDDTSVTLNCGGTGSGNVRYSWQLRNNDQGTWSYFNANGGPTYHTVNNLQQQSRQYRCIVWNDAGLTFSNTAVVTLLG